MDMCIAMLHELFIGLCSDTFIPIDLIAGISFWIRTKCTSKVHLNGIGEPTLQLNFNLIGLRIPCDFPWCFQINLPFRCGKARNFRFFRRRMEDRRETSLLQYLSDIMDHFRKGNICMWSNINGPRSPLRLVFGLNRFFFLFSFNDFLFHDVGAKIHKVLIIFRSKFLSRKGLYNIMFFSIDIHDKFYFFFIELTPILVKCGDS